MRKFSFAGVLITFLLVTNLPAQEQDGAQQRPDQVGRQQEQAQQQHQQQQQIRGTLAGVTVVGEALIDPTSGQAIVAETDYLLVVGRPIGEGERGQRGQRQQEQQREQQQQQEQARQQREGERGQTMAGQRQNVYLIRCTPETQVSKAGQDRQAQARQQQQQQQQEQQKQRQDLAQLDLGDEVVVTFQPAGQRRGAAFRPQQQEEQQNQQGQRQFDRSRHGRDRIQQGEAVAIRILPDEGSQQQGQGAREQEGRQQQRQQD